MLGEKYNAKSVGECVWLRPRHLQHHERRSTYLTVSLTNCRSMAGRCADKSPARQISPCQVVNSASLRYRDDGWTDGEGCAAAAAAAAADDDDDDGRTRGFIIIS